MRSLQAQALCRHSLLGSFDWAWRCATSPLCALGTCCDPFSLQMNRIYHASMEATGVLQSQ